MLYTIDKYVLDTQRRELRYADAIVRVERKVFDVLLVLVKHFDRLVAKEELLARVWPGVSVEEGAVARCIFAARRALGDDGNRQGVIRTIHGQGYRFVARVETTATSLAHAATALSTAATPTPSAPSPSSPSSSPPSGPSAGRNAATVLCGVLSPTPSLSLDLDAERELAERVAALIGDAVAPYDGAVQRLGSDGFTVMFGVPLAREDHARRAVLAALAIERRWQAAIGWGAVSLALHTSIVTVADPRNVAPGILVVAGEAPRVAVELAHTAAGAVVITDDVHRLVNGFFACQPLEPWTPPGHTGPIARRRVLRETEVQSRFDVATRSGLTPLVGRNDELFTLRRCWKHARADGGRVVLIAGEPGIGKTRLVHELTEELAAEAGAQVTFNCSPYHMRSVLHPVIQHLQSALGLTLEDAPDDKLERLRQELLGLRLPLDETLPPLATLLSLPHPAGVAPLAMSPRKQRERTQRALATWLLAQAERGPLCCVWEDLHWADPSSLDLIGLCLDHVPRARLLVVLTFRPEFAQPWAAHSYISALTLSRFDPGQTTDMVRRIVGGRPLPPEALASLVARTDGVPFFIEELTKAVVDAGVAWPVESRHETGTVPSNGIPAALRDSLIARLDRLNGAREVAQVAAVVGREFSSATLGAVMSIEHEALEEALHQLVDAELIHPRGSPRDGRYEFEHGLVQEVAYHSLGADHRRSLHATIDAELERTAGGTPDAVPETVARHLAAGTADRAVTWRQKAGVRATRR